jgi:serine/threonine-protein kinase
MVGDRVRAHLDRILSSGCLGQAESLARLLRYLVEETLAGRANCLKEYTVGVEVFERGSDFDPRIDTIVRTQARRLRGKLAAYYSDTGKTDSLAIELPKGTYVPVFRDVPVERTSPQPVLLKRPVHRFGIIRVVAPVVGVVMLAVYLLLPRMTSPSGIPTQALAVLPFEYLGADRSQEVLADAISEEVREALGGVPGLSVTSRTSAQQYRRSGVDIRKVGASLGVTAIVEGSVRTLGDRVRIGVQLVSTRDGYRLWARSWEGSVPELGSVPTEAARNILGALGVARPEGEAHQSPPQVYRLYMKGRLGSTPESLRYLEEAVRLDPRFAAAHLAIAEHHSRLAFLGSMPPAQALPQAREAGRRALELGIDNASVHLTLGDVAAVHDWDWDTAEKSYLAALQRDSQASYVRLRYALLLAFLGRTAEALDQSERIGAIDPKAVTLAAGQAALYYFARQYDRTIEHCAAVLEAVPQAGDCHFWVGRALLSKGRIEDAVTSLERRTPNPGMGFGSLVTAYVAAGRRAEAQRIRRDVEALSAHRYVSPVSLATMYFAFEERDKAFRELDRAVQARDHSLLNLKVEPAYDAVRADPRFQRILRRLRL